LPEAELPEMRARRCPACQSDRTALAEHVILSGWVVVQEEYRCAACGGEFWVRAGGARPNAPPT
jgi:DNA-directed RNA polymerase subunit RPC12/RpoP